MTAHPSLFESFNARSLDPAQVGAGFIYAPAFSTVTKRQNSVIIGPRGSGKTTLLKMLTLPALAAWRHARASKLLASIEFVAIYVPSDFTWYPDFRRPFTAGAYSALDEVFSSALFRAHVCLAVCDTLKWMQDPNLTQRNQLSRFRLDVPESRIDSFVNGLAHNWDMQIKSGGVFGLRQAVTDRIKSIQYFIMRSALKPYDPDHLIDENQFLMGTFLDDLRAFANLFDEHISRNAVWAACFDEVEIAPDGVKGQIWRTNRSYDQRFLIKCSASPYDDELEGIVGAKTPMGANDFHPIYLTDQSTHETRRFSQDVFSAMCSELRIGPRKAAEILGPSFFNYEEFTESADEIDNRYAKGGFHYRKFESLIAKDQSFKNYMMGRDIEIERLNELPEKMKAAEIRKLISTVTVRDEFLFERPMQARAARQRRYRAKKKVPEIYAGADALFELCEGNPRWLIGFLRPLLEAYKDGQHGQGSKRVPHGEQVRRLERVIVSYLSLLSTVTVSKGGKSDIGIVELVEQIGSYFSTQVLGEKFRPEPVLSFVVDDKVSEAVKLAVGRGVNHGAFILMHEKEKPVTLGSIRGRRLRLTHLLAPIYRLPLVVGRKMELSRLLASSSQTDAPTLLLDLFDEEKDA